MAEQRILREATIAENAVKYQVLLVATPLTITIVGIPLLLFAIPIANWYWRRYYKRLSVRLTTRELKVDRGVLVREEKAIPLEKITDLAVVQGPILRWMGLKGIKVETAGQSSGPSALVNLVGIEDVDAFRDQVLDQRDRITDGVDSVPATTDPADGAELIGVLREIRDSLARIESVIHESRPVGPADVDLDVRI